MAGELSLDSILDASEIENLFIEESTKEAVDKPDKIQEKNKDKNTKETTESINVDTLFTDDSEGVGSEDDDSKQGDGSYSKKDKTSPISNFYSSIANAFVEDGIFPDLDSETIKKITTAEEFSEVVEKQIQAKLDEKQRRIDEALTVGVEPTEIKRYESTLEYLHSINENNIADEGEKGENLRKQLIYQDYINKGFAKEKAQKEVQKSINAGTDLEDAKDALIANKEHFKNQYYAIINENKKEIEEDKKLIIKQSEELKKSILEGKEFIGGLLLDKTIRQKSFEAITKPIYKDPDSGEFYTAIQKYEIDNPIKFRENLSIIYTLTNGFKDLEGLIKTEVKKKVSRGFKELEHTINNTSKSFDGNLKFITGVESDPNSSVRGWDLNV